MRSANWRILASGASYGMMVLGVLITAFNALSALFANLLVILPEGLLILGVKLSSSQMVYIFKYSSDISVIFAKITIVFGVIWFYIIGYHTRKTYKSPSRIPLWLETILIILPLIGLVWFVVRTSRYGATFENRHNSERTIHIYVWLWFVMFILSVVFMFTFSGMTRSGSDLEWVIGAMATFLYVGAWLPWIEFMRRFARLAKQKPALAG